MIKCPVCRHSSVLAFRKNQADFYRCPKCTLVFVNPKQLSASFRDQYLHNESSTLSYYQSTQTADYLTAAARLKLILSLVNLKRGDTILDIGCSTGMFLKAAADLHLHPFGIEPNPLVFSHFLKGQKKYTAYNCFFDSEFLSQHPEKYKLIYSSDVIEHVPDPVEFVSNAKKLLIPDGCLFIITPNFDCFLTRLLQIKPSEHLLYFNQKSLEILIKNVGLTVIYSKPATRNRRLRGMSHSTTFSPGNSGYFFLPLLKFINWSRLDTIISRLLMLFKEDIIIICQNHER